MKILVVDDEQDICDNRKGGELFLKSLHGYDNRQPPVRVRQWQI